MTVEEWIEHATNSPNARVTARPRPGGGGGLILTPADKCRLWGEGPYCRDGIYLNPFAGVGDPNVRPTPIDTPPGEKKSRFSKFLDAVQIGLDIIGTAPALGNLADGVNVLISLTRGDYAGALTSAACMIPGFGQVVAGAKLSAKAGGFIVGVGIKLGRAGEVARGGMWTATKSKTAAQNALRHFKDHGADFGARSAVEYVNQAKQFLGSPPPGTLTRVRANGDVVRYNPDTNTFGVMDASGAPRTFFKPDPAVHGYPTNLEYFNAQ
jgi:hypothetical protein